MYYSTIDPLHLSTNGHNIRIVLMNGGLGNQTFQYIFARWLEIVTGEPCYLDDFNFFVKEPYYVVYEMDRIFKPKANLLTKYVTPEKKEEILWYYKKGNNIPSILLSMGYPLSIIAETTPYPFKGNISYMPSNMYNQFLAQAQGCNYYFGYFINPYFFRDIAGQMLQELEFIPIPDEKNREYARQIEETNSVAVHFRREPTSAFATVWRVSEESYANAVSSLEKWREENNEEEFTYFIFTDNPEDMKAHYKEAGLGDKKIVFVEGNTGSNNYLDCQLMSLCKHRIVTNSSFDYLAALLRKKRDGAMANLNPGRVIL